VGARFSAPVPDRPWGPPSLQYNGYRVFPRGKERPGRDADPSPLLVPWSRKGRAIPLLPLWAVRPVQSLSACTRVQFSLYLHSLVIINQLNKITVNLQQKYVVSIYYSLQNISADLGVQAILRYLKMAKSAEIFYDE
jgi:hypothetical protein